MVVFGEQFMTNVGLSLDLYCIFTYTSGTLHATCVAGCHRQQIFH